MPGSFKKNTALGATPRPINTNIKSRRIVMETEHPVRWSFMKILREYSTLREFYPEINPYTECYKVRDNTWALYNDSMDGAGDVWMYLINGPEKCLLVDTSFGVGDLKGLIKHLVGDKEIIVCNTHNHFDHAYGNAQFDTCYCHEYEVPYMEEVNNEHIWDYLINQTDHDIDVWGEARHPGQTLFTDFDPKDIIKYHHYNIVGVPDGYEFDLGGGYIVEAVLLPGHTAGQCGYFDHQTGCIFIGDTTGMGGKPKGSPHREMCTVEALHDALVKLQPRFEQITGVFPGHGAWDVSPLCLQNLLDTTNQILKNPENYDSIREFERHGQKMRSMTKNIHQWTALRYSPDAVYKQQILDDEKEENK